MEILGCKDIKNDVISVKLYDADNNVNITCIVIYNNQNIILLTSPLTNGISAIKYTHFLTLNHLKNILKYYNNYQICYKFRSVPGLAFTLEFNKNNQCFETKDIIHV